MDLSTVYMSEGGDIITAIDYTLETRWLSDHTHTCAAYKQYGMIEALYICVMLIKIISMNKLDTRERISI
jgi:hypothetical protein